MDNTLIKSNHFGVFTFSSTSHALKAEKLLKDMQAEFMVIPTLREISSSCGLSLKMNPVNIDKYQKYLLENNVLINEVYQVEKQGRKNLITKI